LGLGAGPGAGLWLRGDWSNCTPRGDPGSQNDPDWSANGRVRAWPDDSHRLITGWPRASLGPHLCGAHHSADWPSDSGPGAASRLHAYFRPQSDCLLLVCRSSPLGTISFSRRVLTPGIAVCVLLVRCSELKHPFLAAPILLSQLLNQSKL
jgi:hypothetical protein